VDFCQVNRHPLLADARQGLTDPLSSAQALQLDGRLRIPLGQAPAAPAMLVKASSTVPPLDAELARQSMLKAFDAFVLSLHFADGVTGSSLTDRLLEGMTHFFATGYLGAVEGLREAARLFRAGPVTVDKITRWHKVGNWVADELLDDHCYMAWADRVEGTAREMGALDALSVALLAAAQYKLRAGRVADAEADYAEAEELGPARGPTADLYRLLPAHLHAWRVTRTRLNLPPLSSSK
jgi:hypothetical protein